jgi:hypothetical protein
VKAQWCIVVFLASAACTRPNDAFRSQATIAGAPCASAGGECVRPQDCRRGERILGGEDYNCGSTSRVCCLPSCGGQSESFECCNEDHTYAPRPLCQQGVLICPPGFGRFALGGCLSH